VRCDGARRTVVYYGQVAQDSFQIAWGRAASWAVKLHRLEHSAVVVIEQSLWARLVCILEYLQNSASFFA